MTPKILKSLMNKNIFTALDVHFAGLMTRLSGQEREDLFLAAALASHYQGEGHVCFDLSFMAGKKLLDDDPDSPICPSLDQWKGSLEKAGPVGKPGEYKPLILEGTRLYLYRYWEYEKRLIDTLKERTKNDYMTGDDKFLTNGLDRLFPQNGSGETDWQKVAAFTAALKKFCVISGGPGTGKTFTIAKILALLLGLNKSRPLRIALAAPTGKAAARMQEAIRTAREGLNCSERFKAAIPAEASTIHRLLKTIPDSPYFRYDAKNPLPADVVVIDEASMVDLALLSKLSDAVPRDSRLILLGDKDQLASVEAGAVLGDICDTGNEHGFSRQFRNTYQRITGETLVVKKEGQEEPGIRDSIVQLRKSYRFGPSSGIGAVSRAVNEGNSELALDLMKDAAHEDIRWQDLPRPEALSASLKELVVRGFADYLREDDPRDAIDVFGSFRILCALREGPFGVQGLNLLVEQVLRKEGFYPKGRPVVFRAARDGDEE